MQTQSKPTPLFESSILRRAMVDALRKLNPRQQIKNPVMFIVAVGAILTTLAVVREIFTGQPSAFDLQITVWLWFTVLFANFAEAMAEGRGKAQADSLRKMRTQTLACRLKDGREENVTATDLKRGDLVVCESGDVIPGDGEVVEGIASVDESAITGESAPVIRESGGDRSAVTGGTRVISDRIVVRVTSEQGNTFLDRMIALVEGASRQKTPNEIALTILLSGLTIIFLLAVVALPAFAAYSEKAAGQSRPSAVTLPVLVALLVCLIPTTIGGLLSAIGISGMDRLIQRNVLATSGRAVEAAGDIDVLLLDKTGTITLGNRMATDFIPAPASAPSELADAAQLASLADETPEGRSIVVLAKEQFNLRGRDVAEMQRALRAVHGADAHERSRFPSRGRKSARSIRKGAADAIRGMSIARGGLFPQAVNQAVEDIGRTGGTPLVVAEDREVLGVVQLKDMVKGGINERFAQLRKMGIRTVMITGDNPLTAAAIAAEAGVDDFMAQATPEDKLKRIREEQARATWWP